MKLHEFQTKAIFKREGIPLPPSFISSSPAQAKQAASEIGYPVILKAQSLLSGRGKAGGIRLSKNDDETEKAASDILSIQLRGISIQNILVEKAITVDDEIYLGIFYNPQSGQPSFAISKEGGLSLEESRTLVDSKSYVQKIEPMLGLQSFMVRHACANINIEPKHWNSIEQIALKLWQLFNQYDASLAEINSMVFDKDGRATVLDGKLIIDDNALFRQREFIGYLDPAITSFAQAEARKFDHQLVKMEGNIAIVSNGQGLASASVDMLDKRGLKPGLILILDHNATVSSVEAASRLIQNDPTVKAVLLNVYSNMNDCQEISQGILSAYDSESPLPYYIHLKGSDCEDAKYLLQNHTPYQVIDRMNEAVDLLAAWIGEEHVHFD